MKRFSINRKIFVTCQNVNLSLQVFYWLQFCSNIVVEPLEESPKLFFLLKNAFRKLKRALQTSNPLGRGCNPPPLPGFANYRPLTPIIGPPSPTAQLRALLGGSASLRAIAPPKRRGTSPRVRGCSRIFNRSRSERSAAD